MSMYTSKMKSVSSSLGMIALLSALILSVSPVLAADDKAAAGPVDLNAADEATLQTLPGVGPGIAKQIMAARPFASVEDLSKVKGIGPAKLAALRDKVAVNGTRLGATPPAPPFGAGKVAPPSGPPFGAGKVAPPSGPPFGAGRGAATADADKGTAGPVDLNTADEAALESLPGVGPGIAKQIVAARPFASVEDLSKVKGIGPAKLAVLRDKVTVKGAKPAFAPPARTVPFPSARPAPLAPGAAKSPASLPLGKVNINTASESELEKLPGIGPVKAKAIVAGRPYAKVDDVMKVPGIKAGIFAKIKDGITTE